MLGKWLREQPILLQLDRTLFAHAGISQKLLDSGLSIAEINSLHQRTLIPGQATEIDYQLLHGPQSPTQYRGYVRSEDDYPEADRDLIQRTLERFDVDSIVVGHSKVDALIPRFDDSVFVVENTNETKQTLVIVDGKPKIESLSKLKKSFKDKGVLTRSFELFNRNDWRAFLGVFGAKPDNPLL